MSLKPRASKNGVYQIRLNIETILSWWEIARQALQSYQNYSPDNFYCWHAALTIENLDPSQTRHHKYIHF